MTDYQGNSKKAKAQVEKAQQQEEKKIEKVVQGEVITRKKPLGRKFKDIFISVDFRGVVNYVIGDVLIPAARNMIVDASTKGIERMFYGEEVSRRRVHGNGPRFSYNTPVSRGGRDYREPRTRPPSGPAHRPLRADREEYILSTREDADLVLERMNDIIDGYQVVSVADLNELLGYPIAHTDNNWGWDDLRGVQILQVRNGWLIDFPPAGAIT